MIYILRRWSRYSLSCTSDFAWPSACSHSWKRKREGKRLGAFFLPIPESKISWSNSSRGGSMIFRHLSRSNSVSSFQFREFYRANAARWNDHCVIGSAREARESASLAHARKIGNARNKPTTLLSRRLLWRTFCSYIYVPLSTTINYKTNYL